MKKQKPFIIRWIIRLIWYQLILFVIFYVAMGVEVLIEDFRQGNGFHDMVFYFDLWFPILAILLYRCYLFLAPCVVGGLGNMFIEQKRPKSELLWGLVIHSLGYLVGEFIVIKDTRLATELTIYDIVAYGLILLATVLYWMIKRNKQKKMSSLAPPPLYRTNNRGN